MNADMAAIGGFLLVLGVTTILAIPVMLMQYGPNYLAPGVALFMIIISSVGGAILAYAVATDRSKGQ